MCSSDLRIAETERAIAFMDIFPATPGHALVIPRAHADDALCATDEDLAACMQLASRIGRAAIDGLGADARVPVTAAGPRTLGPEATAVLHHREELGDLLFQVVFQSGLAASWGWFTLDEVIAGIADKLERRHPHVFGEATAGTAAEVIASWEKLKLAEKAGRGALDGVPRSLPALSYALRVGEKAARVGFDWPDPDGPRAKVDEELGEFDRAVTAGERDAMVDELGDLLFSVVNLARKHGIDPEEALVRTNRRFAARFRDVEARARAAGRSLDAHSLAELDAYWTAAKAAERAQ